MSEIKIKIRFASDLELTDDKLHSLCKLINHVYDESESGMWQPGAVRIKKAELKTLIENKSLLLAEIESKIAGCVSISLLSKNIAEFGMLVADLNYRNLGIGRALVKAAEQWALANDRTIMQLKLLTPKNWNHPSKEFLKKWYARIGYVIQSTAPFEKSHPDLIGLLITPCDFTVYHKQLTEILSPLEG